MRNLVARGTAVARAELAHSVHVEVEGLLPGRDYFYQFDAGHEESGIGHFRTAPAPHEMASEVRFASDHHRTRRHSVRALLPR